MGWKEDNRGAGPWPFAEQPNKWGYLNNKRWSRQQDAQEFSSTVGLPLDTDNHWPCGHWHKIPITGPPTTAIPDDDLYIIHGRPTAIGSDTERDMCRKRDKDLNLLISYGGTGSGLNQLNCPFGICVDDTYAWICDKNNSRLMKRLKSDLTYVDHRDSYSRQSCHTDGERLWSGALVSLEELDINTMATVRTNATANPGDPRAGLAYAIDITSDENYLYVADSNNHRVVVYDKFTMVYVTEFGEYSQFMTGIIGCWSDGTYVFVSSNATNRIYKIRISDWALIEVFGSINGGAMPWLNEPYGVFGYGGLLYICNAQYSAIQIKNQSDLSDVGDFVTTNAIPLACYVDASHIFTAEFDAVCRYDRVTNAYIDDSGWLYFYLTGLSGDATYLYAVDQGQNSIFKLFKSDYSTAGALMDPGYALFSAPKYCCVDTNYVYVSDESLGVVHRIDKATMNYVDNFTTAGMDNPQEMSISGGLLYVANYTDGVVYVFDLATLLLVDSSPADNPNTNYVMRFPVGICCDRDYIYVAVKENNAGPAGDCEIVVFNRTTLAFVARYLLPLTAPSHIAVDDSFLYVTDFSITYGDSFLRKYNKTTFVQVDITTDHLQYYVSVDTWYPWWELSGGGPDITVDDMLDEPQVWTME